MRCVTTDSLVLVGDGIAAGCGDARYLGWWGRVLTRTEFAAPPRTAVLPMWNETTVGMAGRWKAEVEPRFAADDGAAGARRVVFQFSSADVTAGLSLARSRLSAANIVDEAAAARYSVFAVGPPPSLVHDPYHVAQLSDAFADVCSRRGIPYVDTFSPLKDHEQWLADLGTTDGLHPSQVGYGMLAWIVLHSQWNEWAITDAAS